MGILSDISSDIDNFIVPVSVSTKYLICYSDVGTYDGRTPVEQVVNDFQFRKYPFDKFPGPKQLLEIMAIEFRDQYGWKAEILRDSDTTVRVGGRNIYNLRVYKNGYNIAYITILNTPCGFANSKEKYKFIRENDY